MEDQYRYRVLPPTASRLFGLALLFGVFIAAGNLALAPFAYAALGIVGAAVMAGGDEALRISGVVFVAGWIAAELAVFMLAFWAAMKWGKFSGATLRFVRPNLADRAQSISGAGT